MKSGYDIFGKAYGVMLRNDLHAINSIDHKFMQEMILLEDESCVFLYDEKPKLIDMRGHELYAFAKRFRETNDRQTIENALSYTAEIANKCHDEFSEMKFGGTEKEILDRGTDWCVDLARVGAVLLTCNGIPARIVHLANLEKAYNGHVVVEAFYEGLYSAVAINEYNPMDKNNDYTISMPNQYYMNLIYTDHQDVWIMGEDL